MADDPNQKTPEQLRQEELAKQQEAAKAQELKDEALKQETAKKEQQLETDIATKEQSAKEEITKKEAQQEQGQAKEQAEKKEALEKEAISKEQDQKKEALDKEQGEKKRQEQDANQKKLDQDKADLAKDAATKQLGNEVASAKQDAANQGLDLKQRSHTLTPQEVAAQSAHIGRQAENRVAASATQAQGAVSAQSQASPGSVGQIGAEVAEAKKDVGAQSVNNSQHVNNKAAAEEQKEKTALGQDTLKPGQLSDAERQQMRQDGLDLRTEMKQQSPNTDIRADSTLYSGPANKGIGTSNQDQSKIYAQASGSNTLDRTHAGQVASEIDIYKTLGNRYGFEGNNEADQVQRLASREYVSSLRGEVKTHIAGAAPDRVVRSDEIHVAMTDRGVTGINGVDAKELRTIYEAERKEYNARSPEQKSNFNLDPAMREENKFHPNKTYEAIVQAELKQDMAQGMRTGDPTLIRGVVSREEAHKDQQNVEQKKPQENIVDINKRVDERSTTLAAESQDKIKQEAQQRIDTHIQGRLDNGSLTPDQAERVKTRMEDKLSDPAQAYKINAGLQMSEMRSEIQSNPTYKTAGEWVEARKEYLGDTQLTSQIQGPSRQTSQGEYLDHKTFSDHRAGENVRAEVQQLKFVANGFQDRDQAQETLQVRKHENFQEAEKKVELAHTQNQAAEQSQGYAASVSAGTSQSQGQSYYRPLRMEPPVRFWRPQFQELHKLAGLG